MRYDECGVLTEFGTSNAQQKSTTYQSVNHDGFVECAHAGHLDGFQVEDINTVEITQKLESLKTGCLLFTGVSAGWSGWSASMHLSRAPPLLSHAKSASSPPPCSRPPNHFAQARNSYALGRDFSRLTSRTVELRSGRSAGLDEGSGRERADSETRSRGGFGDGRDRSERSAEGSDYRSHCGCWSKTSLRCFGNGKTG